MLRIHKFIQKTECSDALYGCIVMMMCLVHCNGGLDQNPPRFNVIKINGYMIFTLINRPADEQSYPCTLLEKKKASATPSPLRTGLSPALPLKKVLSELCLTY